MIAKRITQIKYLGLRHVRKLRNEFDISRAPQANEAIAEINLIIQTNSNGNYARTNAFFEKMQRVWILEGV
jgi:hypothetical protein